ncbi:hypothetical protein [Bradyrhizobium sp. SZCCHNRI20481]|uniref:hypothetical protein n=1 Tax=Bradyrhizobium sp. SZCCHNRI20481 TaxID=3057286 RepID=UPI00291639F1|nr:hypothetical protein [Bradyrhizobium sp. SZCCHNRI20481]
MHPADQFERFHALHTEKGLGAEDIGARFGVTPAVVRQRLKLAAVSPLLIEAYREGCFSLAELSAFAITDDTKRQEQVWNDLGPDVTRQEIIDALTEAHVAASDPRAIFIGKDAYCAAGGAILSDLFDEEHEGFFTDAALLFDLAAKKLEAAAGPVRAEGWKWVEIMPRFDHTALAACRRVYPDTRPMSEDEQLRLAALEEQYEALEIDYDSEEAVAEAERLEAEIEALRGEDVFARGCHRAGGSGGNPHGHISAGGHKDSC